MIDNWRILFSEVWDRVEHPANIKIQEGSKYKMTSIHPNIYKQTNIPDFNCVTPVSVSLANNSIEHECSSTVRMANTLLFIFYRTLVRVLPRNSGVAVITYLNTKLFSHQQQSDSGGWHASKSNQIELYNLNNFFNFV